MKNDKSYDYDQGNESKKGGFDKWVILGLLIGVLACGGFYIGRAYEVYRFSEIADQVARKCTDILEIIQSPIQLPQPGQGATPVSDARKILSVANVLNPEVFAQNANPPVAKLMTNIETEWIDCPPVTDDEEPVDPTADYETVEVDVRLRDLRSEDFIWLDEAGVAEIGADQDVVVWVNLPDGIDNLNARFESSYPAEIKAGETGTIEVNIICYDNQTKYVGSLDMIATDDLSLGTARRLTRNAYYDYFTVKHKYFALVEDESRLHTHITYALYTSCDDETEMYGTHNGVYSSDLALHYAINKK